jgi:hypothetical protein
MDNFSVRVIANKSDSMTDHAIGTRGRMIIVTLPKVEDRYVLIGKIKRSLKSAATRSKTTDESQVYVDPDLTPVEAQEQFTLRTERNAANASRSAEDQLKFYYNIRHGKVVKVSM